MKRSVVVSGLFALMGLTSIPGAAQAQATTTSEVPAAAPPSAAQPQPAATAEPLPAAQAQAVTPAEPLPAGQAQAVAPVQPLPAAQTEAAAPEDVQPAKRPWAASRVGFAVTLFGPNSLIGGGLSLQPIPWLELLAWGGYNSASASGSTGVAYAEAEIKVLTGMARARFWPLGNHSVIVDTGVGVTNYSMSANGHGTMASNIADTLDYSRKGTPVIGNLGVGYGYRSNSSFRIAVVFGVLLHAKKLGDGSVTSSGSFTEQDRNELRTSVDGAGNSLTNPRGYLDVTIGMLF